MTRGQATEPVYPFGAPGADVALFTGDMTVGDTHGTGRVWMHTTGRVDHRWELDPDGYRSLRLGETRLTFEHPALGHVDVPVRVTSNAGRGIVQATSAGNATALDQVVAHWVNVPSIYPASGLKSDWGTWGGRWAGSGGGWSLVLDARPDHNVVATQAEDTPFHVVTHTGVLRRADGRSFTPEQAADGLAACQVAVSFALGRWVAPALAVGFAGGARVWELWSPWRCDTLRDAGAWWDTQRGGDLRAFLGLFLDAWADPARHDRTRHVAAHVIESNKGTVTLEARIMLAGAGLEYLSWVRCVLDERRRSAAQHSKRSAARNLRELLDDAGIPADVPADLGVVERLRVDKPREDGSERDGPDTVAWVRNRLVHPRDAQEPYRLDHLLEQTWHLLMQYGELLLLQDVGYTGSFRRRFPPGRWAHDSVPVPWAPGGTPPAKRG